MKVNLFIFIFYSISSLSHGFKSLQVGFGLDEGRILAFGNYYYDCDCDCATQTNPTTVSILLIASIAASYVFSWFPKTHHIPTVILDIHVRCQAGTRLVDITFPSLNISFNPFSIIGDINGDRFNDAFTVSSDQKILKAYIWDPLAVKFNIVATIDINTVKLPKLGMLDGNYIIANALAADFNNDGFLDLLIVINTVGFISKNEFECHLVLALGNGKTLVMSDRKPVKVGVAQPFIADVFGTLTPTVLAQNSSSTSASHIVALKYYPSIDDKYPEYDFSSTPLLISHQDKSETTPSCIIPHPHSNAFLDLDGDCLADLFLVCTGPQPNLNSIQIWISNVTTSIADANTAAYHLALTMDLPEGSGQITFADMDADGTIDLVFPVCTSSTDCSLHILYNQQIPICSNSGGGPCRDSHELCKGDPNFHFDLDSPLWHFKMDISKLVPDEYLITLDSEYTGILPIPLRIGDFNNDGFPDIVILTRSKFSENTKKVQILESHADSNGKRNFSPVKAGMEMVHQNSHAVGAALMDITNDGALDLIVVYKEGGKLSTTVFTNKYFFDAFFFKPLVLNGLCLGAFCPVISVPDVKVPTISHMPYGVNYAGASFKYSITDTKGNLRVVQSIQLPQQAYQSLLSAGSVIGLGRTNNYIEDLFVGVSRREVTASETPRHVANYQGIIPNAALVISPYEPPSSPGNTESFKLGSSSTWTLELYMNPSSTTTAIVLVLIVVLICLSFFIMLLEIAERREDDAEKRTRLHALNFDAL